MKNVSDTSFRENEDTHTSCSINLFPQIAPFVTLCGETWHSLTGHRLQKTRCDFLVGLLRPEHRHTFIIMNTYWCVKRTNNIHLFSTCFEKLSVHLQEVCTSSFMVFYHASIYAVCGPGSVVCIATGYGLDGLGIETRWGQDFLPLSRPALGG